MLFMVDEEQIFKHWTEERIEGYARDMGITYLEAILYLWLFNFVSISRDDWEKNCGREMYKKFAKGFVRFLEGRF